MADLPRQVNERVVHDQGARGFTRSIEEIEAERERELLASIDQIENDLLDQFAVRPVTARRAIAALTPYLPGGR